ncbi:MAG TPA: lipoyl(octanoyl) transferase LipB [Candidatus Acidoferrales bacterium]|nr:lipoyl(octanoyl) transferase LipB [Candidatus Acidoferrales bacterium]
MANRENACWVAEMGIIPYERACELQRRLVELRKGAEIPDVLLLCEHPHTITLGRNGSQDHLLASGGVLRQLNVEFYPTNRGGDITYHGPGQIVGYPILDLTRHRRDVRWFVEQLEETMIRTSADFSVKTRRAEGMHGAWVETPGGMEKIGALGVHLSRWVTSHGFAYNVSTDLRYFDLIVPCGLAGMRATSLERATGRTMDSEEVRGRIVAHFADAFDAEPTAANCEALSALLPDFFEAAPAMAAADRA